MFNLEHASAVGTVRNSLVYGCISNGIFQSDTSTGTLHVENCTVADNASTGVGTFGISSDGGTLNTRNCYSGSNNGQPDYNNVTSMTSCASSDATGTGGLQSIAYSTSAGAFFTNITPRSEISTSRRHRR